MSSDTEMPSNEKVIQQLELRGFDVKTALENMESRSSDISYVKECCGLLQAALRIPRVAAVNHGIENTLVPIMDEHVANKELMETSVALLCNVLHCLTNPLHQNNVSVTFGVSQTVLVRLVTKVMYHHTKSVEIQFYSVQSLRMVAGGSSNEFGEDIAANVALIIPSLFSTMAWHEQETSVQVVSVNCLCKVLTCNNVDACVTVRNLSKASFEILLASMACLLNKRNKDVPVPTKKNLPFLVGLVVQCIGLERFASAVSTSSAATPAVKVAVLQAVHGLVVAGGLDIADELESSGFLSLAVLFLKENSSNANIVYEIHALFTMLPNKKKLMAATAQEAAAGGTIHVLLSSDLSERTARNLSYVFATLYELYQGDEAAVKKACASVDWPSLVVSSMKRHMHDEELRAYAGLLLSRMLSTTREFQQFQECCTGGGFVTLQLAMRQFPANATIQLNAVFVAKFICKHSATNLVKPFFFQSGFVNNVCDAMQAHSDNMLMQIHALEVLTYLVYLDPIFVMEIAAGTGTLLSLSEFSKDRSCPKQVKNCAKFLLRVYDESKGFWEALDKVLGKAKSLRVSSREEHEDTNESPPSE